MLRLVVIDLSITVSGLLSTALIPLLDIALLKDLAIVSYTLMRTIISINAFRVHLLTYPNWFFSKIVAIPIW